MWSYSDDAGRGCRCTPPPSSSYGVGANGGQMEGVGGGGAQPCDLIPRLHLELEPMGGRWRGLEEEVVEPSPVISSFSLSRLCRLSLQHSTHQPLKQHCIKGKTKIPRYNMKCGGKTRCYLKNFMKYLVFPLHFVLYHGILNYLWPLGH